jgi:hypothetical protein
MSYGLIEGYMETQEIIFGGLHGHGMIQMLMMIFFMIQKKKKEKRY